MRIAFPALILLLLTLLLAESSPTQPIIPFKSSQIELMVELEGRDNGRSSFPLAERYQPNDKILANLLDFELTHSEQPSVFGLVSWEVRHGDFSSGVTLEVTRSADLHTKTLLKLKLQLLKFSADLPQGAIFLQAIKLSQNPSMLTLENQMLLTVSREKVFASQYVEKRYTSVALLRGLEADPKANGELMPFLSIKSDFAGESHVHVVISGEGIKSCSVSIIIFDREKLMRLSLTVSMLPFHLQQEKDNHFSVSILSELKLKPCQKELKTCWNLQPESSTLQLRIDYLNQLKKQTSIIEESLQQDIEQFDFKGRIRLLSSSSCDPSSCSCTPFPYATSCYQDSRCRCKVRTCAAGYYTAGSLVSSCTACPASLTHCTNCGLKFGTTTVICYTCAAGYTPLSGVCTACLTGCSTCTTVLVNLVSKVSCQTCVSNLQLQTSGSIKICGCLSNQFLNLAASPVTCVTCPATCLTCTALATCTTCATSYYLQAGSCLACMPVCKTCTTSTTCATCFNSVFTLVGGVCTCPATLFYDSVTKTCLSCSVLQPNCLACSYSAVFDPANPPSVVCTSAATGYYLTAGSAAACISYCNNCDLTPTPVCSTCNTNLNFTFDAVSSTCLCSATYFFSPSTSSCLSCAQVLPGCLTCITNVIPAATQCSSCDTNGYFPTTAYPTSSCTACPSLCTTCSDLLNCLTCLNNLVVISGACTCNSGASLFLDSITKTCLACGTVIINCQTCNSATTPVSCTTCVTGTYPSADSLTCYPCPSTCSACSSNTVCSACEPGYDLVSNACVCGSACTDCQGNSTVGLCASCTYSPFTCSSCSTGYILTAPNACTLCSGTWPNCAECTAVTCLSCDSPFIIGVSGCECNNTAGLYLDATSTSCLTCSAVISQCTTCVNSGATTCSGCTSGYYLANALTCSICAGNCLTCTTNANHCLTCLVTYTMVSPNTCDCDFANQYYYNPSTGGCSSCAALIPHCQTCTIYLVNQAQCSTCDSYYYWDAGTSSCSPCPSSCGLCTSLTVCTSCPNNLVLSQSLGMATPGLCVCDNTTVFLNTQTNTCQSCAFNIPSCISCTAGSPLTCNSCLPSTYLYGNACVNCPSSCATCNQTQCLSCPGTLTLSNGVCVCDGQCGQCETLSVGCLSCTIVSGAITSCLLCEQGTYLSSPSCLACPSTCATCTSSTNCLTCQPTYVLINGLCSCATSLSIYPNSDSLCVLCSLIFDSCTECGTSGGSTVCVACKDGLYLTGGICQPCDSTCLTCTGSATTCTSCVTGQTLSGTSCVCSSASCLACSAVSTNCVECVYTIYGALSKCQTCSPGFYPTALGSCTTCPTVCNTCGANGVCLTCSSTFSVIGGTCACNAAMNLYQSGSTCQLCDTLIPLCTTCVQDASAALNVSCAQCDSGHYYVNASSTCVPSVCGDGLTTSGESCDDGNTISGDGCSSFCLTETFFACSGSPSVCVQNVNFHITVDTIETSKITCNRVSISFKLDPIYDSFSTADFRNMLGYVSETSLNYLSWTYSSGKVTYEFDYTSTLSDVSTSFSFMPSALMISETAGYPIIITTFTLTPTNNIALIYYKPQVCDKKKTMQAAATAVEYASYGTLAISMLPCKIVGLELFGVLQMAHINVGNMDNVNTLLTPLMGMKGVHGYSMNMGEEKPKSRLLQSSSYTPGRVQSIGYESNFLRNCNLMLIIVVAIIIVSLILYLLTCFCKKCAPSLHSISKRIIKEVLLTLILFNCFNFAYSAGIHFSYAPKDDSLYTLGTVAAIVAMILPILMALGLMCAEDEGFGEYKEKFKPGFVERLYFVVTIVYRTGIGLYISTMNEDSMSTLIVIALSLAFLLYNLVNLPYAKAYHNYRANICHLTQFVCLFVALYYRSMMSSTSRTAMSTVFSPVYLQFSCICLSLIVSLIVLVYEIYIFILECWQKKDNRKISEDSASNEKHATTEGNLEKINASQQFQSIQEY